MLRSRSWLILGITAVVVVVAVAINWIVQQPLPHLTKIQRLADAGKWEEAYSSITAYLSRRPRDAIALMLAARIAAGSDRLDDCVNILEHVPADSPLKVDALTRQGQALHTMNLGRCAEQAWREVIHITEDRSPAGLKYRAAAQAELVSLLSLERRAAEAQEILWQMYPTHAEKWRLLVALARVQGRAVRPEASVPILEQFVDRDPEDLDARRALALYYIDLFQWDKAIGQAGTCREQDSSDIRSLEILLECHLRLKQWDEMAQILARTEIDGQSARLWQLRAFWLEATGHSDTAEASFREALRLCPQDPTAHFQFAQLLQRLGKTGVAEESLALHRKLKSHDDALANFIALFATPNTESWTAPAAATCVELGEHCLALGRVDEARGWFKEALRQQPSFPAAVDGLNRLVGNPSTSLPNSS